MPETEELMNILLNARETLAELLVGQEASVQVAEQIEYCHEYKQDLHRKPGFIQHGAVQPLAKRNGQGGYCQGLIWSRDFSTKIAFKLK